TLAAARRDFAVATLSDGRVIIMGGRTGPGNGTVISGVDAVVEFDPRANTFTPKGTAGFTPRISLGAAAVETSLGTRVYAMGGYSGSGPAATRVNIVEECDPVGNKWGTVAPLPTAVAQFGITVAGGINAAEPLQLVHVVSGNTATDAAPVLADANNIVQR